MPSEDAKIDANYKGSLIAVTDDSNKDIRLVIVDPVTGRLLVQGTGSFNLYDSQGNIINPATDGIGIGTFDYVSVAYPVDTTEVYSFYQGGAGGTLTAIVTVVYTDNTKALLSTVTKTSP